MSTIGTTERGSCAVKKAITVLLFCLALLTVLAALLYSPETERFSCDHCHRTVTEKPIHIAEQTVDMTVCSDCYHDYLKGMWKICQS